MRKILTLFTALITILSLATNAQEKTGKVSGIIRDGGQKTIVSASIMLLRAKDSSVAKITLAGKDGSYQFEKIEDGKKFYAEIPAFRGAWADGSTQKKVVEQLRSVLKGWIELQIERGQSLPSIKGIMPPELSFA